MLVGPITGNWRGKGCVLKLFRREGGTELVSFLIFIGGEVRAIREGPGRSGDRENLGKKEKVQREKKRTLFQRWVDPAALVQKDLLGPFHRFGKGNNGTCQD